MGDLYVDGARLEDGSAWATGATGQVRRLATAEAVAELERDHAAWDHVVLVGPAAASAADVWAARAALRDLVRGAGPALAHGGVGLPGGWRTTYADARTALGTTLVFPDRRDALLAGLRQAGSAGADRAAELGPRSSVLAGLLGPRATTRVGAALSAALDDERWDAIVLAAAASDLVGPERVEAILALTSAAPLAPEPWSAIVAARQLAEVLERYPERRRGELLSSLWLAVAAQVADDAEVARRQSYLLRLERDGRLDRIVAERAAVEDANLVTAVQAAPDVPARPVQFFLLNPHTVLWRWLDRAVGEAVRATALLRLAIADRDGRLGDALLDATDLLERLAGVPAAYPDQVVVDATRRRPLTAWRSLAHVWDVLQVATRPHGRPRGVEGVPVRSGDPEPAVRRFIAPAALDLAHAALADVNRVFGYLDRNLFTWPDTSWFHLRLDFRDVMSADPARIAGWDSRFTLYSVTGTVLPGMPESSLRDAAGAGSGRAEHVLDGVWLGELVDAMAELHAHDAGIVEIAGVHVRYQDDPEPETEPDPLAPSVASLPVAIATVAQLVELGADAPAKPRSWTELGAKLHATIDVESWFAGEFRVPRVFRDADGTDLPGTRYTIRVASASRTLAQWGNFMSNCIASYADEGRRGKSVLVGLYDGNVLAHNVEVRRARNRWMRAELMARFNEDSPIEVYEAVDEWLVALTREEADRRAGTATHIRPPGGRSRGRPRRRPSPAQVERARLALARSVAATLDASAEAVDGCDRLVAALAGGGPAAVSRAAGPVLADAVERVVIGPGGGAAVAALLASDPLGAAVAALDAGDRAVLSGVERLAAAADPATAAEVTVPNRLMAVPRVADAVAVAQARRAVGAALAGVLGDADRAAVLVASDRVLGAALVLARPIDPDAAASEVTVPVAADGTVDGFPASNLCDGGPPWAEAWQAAGAIAPARAAMRRAAMAAAIAAGEVPDGLSVPAAWLGRGGWRSWWRRMSR